MFALFALCRRDVDQTQAGPKEQPINPKPEEEQIKDDQRKRKKIYIAVPVEARMITCQLLHTMIQWF